MIKFLQILVKAKPVLQAVVKVANVVGEVVTAVHDAITNHAEKKTDE